MRIAPDLRREKQVASRSAVRFVRLRVTLQSNKAKIERAHPRNFKFGLVFGEGLYKILGFGQTLAALASPYLALIAS